MIVITKEGIKVRNGIKKNIPPPLLAKQDKGVVNIITSTLYINICVYLLIILLSYYSLGKNIRFNYLYNKTSYYILSNDLSNLLLYNSEMKKLLLTLIISLSLCACSTKNVNSCPYMATKTKCESGCKKSCDKMKTMKKNCDKKCCDKKNCDKKDCNRKTCDKSKKCNG